MVTVGGSGVGTALLRRAADAFALAAKRVPGLRMVLVDCGPRIDPASVAVAAPGSRCTATCPTCGRHLAACDLAVVQGGLSTTMELTAVRRPFVFVPLRHHFEQQVHVPHRLAQYGAGRRLEYAERRRPRAAGGSDRGRDRPAGGATGRSRPTGRPAAAALLAELL